VLVADSGHGSPEHAVQAEAIASELVSPVGGSAAAAMVSTPGPPSSSS